MKDHTLFQAICRTNRLDGEDKDFGHIVDYKELYEEVQTSIAVYNSDDLDTDADGGTSNVILKDYLAEGKITLDNAREALHYLCDPVPIPREVEQYLHYFCGEATNPKALNDTEPLRISFYKTTATFLRAYASIARKLEEAGYSKAQIATLEHEVKFYTDIRAAIKNYSGEELDIKPYEADMRHLINTYIQANSSEPLGNLSPLSLTELIIKTGIHDAIAQKLNQQGRLSKNAIAETIINNVRKTIIRNQLTDPKFYDQMSKLLDDLIQQKRTDTESYEQFLQTAEALVNRMARNEPDADIPTVLHSKQEAIVLFNNLASIPATAFQCPEDAEAKAAIALALDKAICEKAPADWKGDKIRETQVLNAIFPIMGRDRTATLAIFEIVKNQGNY